MRTTLRRLLWRLRPPVLALGGGGARGFAHIGVLQVLEEERLPIRGIAGTSMGALVGAMYLIHHSTSEVMTRWRETIDQGLIPTVPSLAAAREPGAREHPLLQAARRIKSRVVISMAINRAAMLDGEPMKRALEVLLPEVEISDLGLPFVAVATDLATGEEVQLTQGPLRDAIRASSSIPGLLPAITVGGRVLVDGAVKAEVPVGAARSLGRPVLAIDVSIDLPPLKDGGLVLDTMMRTQLMTSMRLKRMQLSMVRQVIRPAVGHATWAEWDRFDEMIEAGRVAARAWLDRPLLRRTPAIPPLPPAATSFPDKERADKERAGKELTDKERAGKERADKERAGKELTDKERADKERADKGRADKERADKGRADKERADKGRADKERAESEPS